MNGGVTSAPALGPSQQFLNDRWEEHIRTEFVTRDTAATLETMVPNAYVNHIPVLTGGVGHEQLREFYARHFIPRMPPDTAIVPVSRTIGTDRLVDEMIFQFTHTIEMDWMLPGIAPTGKRVEVPLVVVVHFHDGKLAHEHIYWDQATVLVQLGLLDQRTLPVVGAESAAKVLDPKLPSNALMERSGRGARASSVARGAKAMVIVGIEHVQLGMPAGREAEARQFYSGLLGIPEVPKPPELAKRGGAWFGTGTVRIHLGVEADFRPAHKAHPALRVRGLRALVEYLREVGVEVVHGPLEGYHRVYVADPFGNRIELMEREEPRR